MIQNQTGLLSTLFLCTLVHGCVHDYGEVIEKSLLFYEAQVCPIYDITECLHYIFDFTVKRSGPLPSSNRVPSRVSSTLTDEVVGGYFDAGDHVKFGFAMASAATQLAWGVVSFRSGFEVAGQLQCIKECLMWFTDYFIACHKSKFEFIGQIGDGYLDHAFWGRPEEMTMARTSFRINQTFPGSELAGETAGALAAASIFYRDIGETWKANEALQHARDLFEFADTYRGSYANAMPVSAFYDSYSGYNDELTWSAAWLAMATGESQYLNKAKSFYDQFSLGYIPNEFSWDNKVARVQVLMYNLTWEGRYYDDVSKFLGKLDTLPLVDGSKMVFVSKWGSNRHGCSALGIQPFFSKGFALEQVNAILGVNKQGRSFMVRYGNNPPLKAHHSGNSCPDRPALCDWSAFRSLGPNPQELTGAIVGGPAWQLRGQTGRLCSQ